MPTADSHLRFTDLISIPLLACLLLLLAADHDARVLAFCRLRNFVCPRFFIGAAMISLSKTQFSTLFMALIPLCVVGCTVAPPRISGYPTGVPPATHQALQQQQANLMARFEELNARTASLDADNQRLQAHLAQQQQQTAKMQASLQQSRDTVADLRDELTVERRNQGSYAGQGALPSTEVGYTPGGNLPLASIPGADVKQDGGDLRIRLDGAQLFASGKASIKNTSQNSKLIDDVVSTIQSQYPQQHVTVEGHTDSDPIRRSSWKNNKELSLGRARAVYHALRKRGLQESQLSVVGYGSSRPLADNNSKAGKARNRRVEIVIHAQQPR